MILRWFSKCFRYYIGSSIVDYVCKYTLVPGHWHYYYHIDDCIDVYDSNTNARNTAYHQHLLAENQ